MICNSKQQQVIDLVRVQPVVRPKDLTEHGLLKDYLYILAQEGMIERIARGLYQWPNKDLGRYQSLAEVCKFAPKAVVALLSALNYLDQLYGQVSFPVNRVAIVFPPCR